MKGTLNVIFVNRCNQSDKFRTVLPAKMYVRVWRVFRVSGILSCSDQHL